ncbi:hypothetical protein [Blastococcus sp. SYSU D00813]
MPPPAAAPALATAAPVEQAGGPAAVAATTEATGTGTVPDVPGPVEVVVADGLVLDAAPLVRAAPTAATRTCDPDRTTRADTADAPDRVRSRAPASAPATVSDSGAAPPLRDRLPVAPTPAAPPAAPAPAAPCAAATGGPSGGGHLNGQDSPAAVLTSSGTAVPGYGAGAGVSGDSGSTRARVLGVTSPPD